MNEPRKPGNTSDIANEIFRGVQKKTLKEEDLIQIIELCGGLLDLKTISDYTRSNNISYNGAKKFRNVRNIFNVKFLISKIKNND